MDKHLHSEDVMQYFIDHSKAFEEDLLNEAGHVRHKIDEIMSIGNIDLISNAHTLVGYVIEGKMEEMDRFAKQEGIAWATHSLTLSLKLEWVQAIRRTLWKFVEKYIHEKQAKPDFFSIERKINNQIDHFLNSFFINYSTYKDALLNAQRELVENLSVPIIPISKSTCILPIIGAVDYFRAKVLEEKVLMEIGRLHIQTLFMDLSGIAEMENVVIDELMKVIDGAALMGCKTVITGLRPDVVRKMISLGARFDSDTKTLHSLQQALNLYFVK